MSVSALELERISRNASANRLARIISGSRNVATAWTAAFMS